MPLSSVLGASSVIKPGVCTSTTRPSVPYEGQLIYETDTDKVASYNGSAWVYTATGGLIVVKPETAFSAASSVTADSVFTGDFTNYRLIVNYTTSTTNDLSLKLRVSGSSTSTNYNYARINWNGTALSGSGSTSQTSLFFGQQTQGDYKSVVYCDIGNPQLAVATTFQAYNYLSIASFTPRINQFYGNQSDATAFDGIELLVATGTTTGSYTIYGYNK